jgi:hypothetical protein
MTNGIQGPDWQGIGYLVSGISVLFLGAVAWPRAGEPSWIAVAVVIGCATSMIGMALRYVAHCRQQREVKNAKREARQANSARPPGRLSGA